MRYLALILLLVSCSHAPKAPDPQIYDQLVVVGTNDFHGYLKNVEADVSGHKVASGGAEWFAGYVRVMKEKFGDRLIMLDGGDLFQGTLESNYFYGRSTMDYYNQLPYRAAVVGNHEFDYGPGKKGGKDHLASLKELMARAKFPFVQSNIFWKKSGKLWREKNLQPSILVLAGGHKVGIIGLTTTSTPAKTLPQNVVALEFRDFVEPAIEQSRILRENGAELVLVVTHEGGEKEGEPLFEMLKKLPPGTIDGVVAGHSHMEIHQFVHGVPVIQSKTKGLFFGRIDFYVNRQTGKIDPALTKIHDMVSVCGTWFKNEEKCDAKVARDRLAQKIIQEKDLFPLRTPTYEGVEVKPDLSVRRVLAPYFAQVQAMQKEVLGYAQKDFEVFPSGESQTGFLFLDAYKEKFPYARVILNNGGGLRRAFMKGPITYGDLFEVHPFENFALAVQLNGKQLKDLLRLGVSGNQSLPFFRGIKVEYYGDDSPAYARDINGDGKKETWERDRLKSIVWEDTGKPVKDEDECWVATNEYLTAGGDNSAHIFGGLDASRKRYLEINQRDVVAEYLRKHPKLVLPTKEPQRLFKVQ